MQIDRLKAASAVLAATFAIGLAASPAASADALSELVDTYYDALDKYQDTVTRSARGVAEAMQEGEPSPPPPPGSNESSINYFLRNYNELDYYHRLNKDRFDRRQTVLNHEARLLRALPQGDPRRSKITKEFLDRVKQQGATRESRDTYGARRQGFHERIQDYKKRTGSYPPHNCASAPGWHLPEGASCDDPPAPDSTPSPAPSGHHGP